MNICILCAGTWGTALAKILSENNKVIVWDRSEKEVKKLNSLHIHKNLPGVKIPDTILFTNNLKQAIANSEAIILASPFKAVRSIINSIKDYVNSNQLIISLSKGLEYDTLFTATEIIKSILPDNNIVALSGPSHAEEVAANIPTSLIAASKDIYYAEKVKELFNDTNLNIRISNDVIGVQLCGALKNIVALACGIAIGKGGGNNTLATIITDGLKDLVTVGKCFNCDEDTFYSIAGIGDLIVTCTCNYSRNFNAGKLLGEGLLLEDVQEKIGMVIEGVEAMKAVSVIEERFNVCFPVFDKVKEYLK